MKIPRNRDKASQFSNYGTAIRCYQISKRKKTLPEDVQFLS